MLLTIGFFKAPRNNSTYQVLGLAYIRMSPEFLATWSKLFGTPSMVILLSTTLISIGVSYMDYTDIVSSANFLYSFGMLLELTAFVWLRRKLPMLNPP